MCLKQSFFGKRLKMSPLALPGRHDRFGSLCNLGLSKKQRFSLQRHKAQEFCKAEFLDSLPVSSFAAFATLVYQRYWVFLCKGTKAPECTPVSCFTNALCQNLRILQSRILGLYAGSRFGTRHAVRGFGSRLLESQGILDAKAALETRRSD